MNHLGRTEFWSEVFTLHNSVTPCVKARIATFGLIALVVWFIGSHTSWIPSTGVVSYEFVGVVLALLLVLRTNSGYDRWYEGRKLWGGIVNQSRNLAQVGLAYGPRDWRWRNQFVRWTAAFGHACRHSLRGERNVDDLRGLLSDRDVEELSKARCMPMYVSRRIAALLQEAQHGGHFDRFAFLQADQQRTELINHFGGCERILKTPLAKALSVKIRRFLFLYLVALPFGIFDKADFMSPLIVMLVAYPLLSLDQIGVELQNPFSAHRLSHLPLDAICETIQDDLIDSLDAEAVTHESAKAETQRVA